MNWNNSSVQIKKAFLKIQKGFFYVNLLFIKHKTLSGTKLQSHT